MYQLFHCSLLFFMHCLKFYKCLTKIPEPTLVLLVQNLSEWYIVIQCIMKMFWRIVIMFFFPYQPPWVSHCPQINSLIDPRLILVCWSFLKPTQSTLKAPHDELTVIRFRNVKLLLQPEFWRVTPQSLENQNKNISKWSLGPFTPTYFTSFLLSVKGQRHRAMWYKSKGMILLK